jgi:hypothetical protein
MANTTRFLIEVPDVGQDSDTWGSILVSYLNGLEALVTDKRGDTLTGPLTATLFTGSGAGLNSLNASNIATGTIANARTTATSANTANSLVVRDENGAFSAGIISATLAGNAATATTATNLSGGTVNATTGTFSGAVSGVEPVASSNLTTKNYVDTLVSFVGSTNVRTYVSYAAALADLNSVLENQVVLVLVDETKNDFVVYYRKVSGALVFVSFGDTYKSPVPYVQTDSVRNMITKLLVLTGVIPEVNPVINANFTNPAY